MKKSSNIYFLMILASIFWAGAFIAGKLGVNQFSPLMLTYLRFLFALIIIFPFMMYKEKSNWKIKKNNIPEIFFLGLIGMVGYHLLFFSALKYTTATKASMINASNPIITAVLASFFLNESLTFKKVLLIFMAFTGVTLTIIDWDFSKLFEMTLNIGDLLMLSATSCWAFYSILVKKFMKNYTPLKLMSYTILSCIVLLTPFALKEIFLNNALAVGVKPYIAILYMAIFPTVFGYTIQQKSIKEIGAGKSSLFINLVPVFSTIMAILFLKEKLNPINIISALIIISSVIMYSRLNIKKS